MLMFYLNLIDTNEEKNKFEEIYNNYKDLMLYIAFDILKDNYLAEDVVHNVFLKIITDFKKFNFDNNDKTKNFVAILTKNTAITMYRKKKNVIEVDFEMNTNNFTNNNIDESMKINFIKEEIKKMSDTYKDVLSLKFFNGFSNKEIASVLNVSESVVRKRIERARKILEEKLI